MSQSLSYLKFGTLRIVLLGILLIVLCNTGVSAATISVDVSGNINNWMFQPGQDNTNSSLYLTVVSDTGNWYIYARDALNDGKPESSAGHMAEWYSSAYVASPHVLSNNMSVTASAGSGYQVGNAIMLSNTFQRIVTGSATGSPVTIPIVITQPVTTTDVNLTGSHVYRIITTYAGSFI